MFDQKKFRERALHYGILYVTFAWFAIVAFFPLLAVFGLFINPGYDFNVMPINRSRMALGFFGPVFSVTPLMMVALSAGLAKYLTNHRTHKD